MPDLTDAEKINIMTDALIIAERHLAYKAKTRGSDDVARKIIKLLRVVTGVQQQPMALPIQTDTSTRERRFEYAEFLKDFD